MTADTAQTIIDSPIRLRASELLEALRYAIRARQPILVLGQPGLGKTDLGKQAAQLEQAIYISTHPGTQDPTDNKGLPAIVDGKAVFLPFGQLRQAMAAKTPLVWALEDVGQATNAVQASLMPLLSARGIDGMQLAECVTFIGTTNDRTHRAGVTGLLEPVKSRFASIVELVAHIDDWASWYVTTGLPAEVLSFLRANRTLLCPPFVPTADLVNQPSPRTWAHLARLLVATEGASDKVRRALFSGAVGADAAASFLAYLDLLKTLPTIKAILADPKGAVIPKEPGQLYAIATGLAQQVTPKTFGAVATYAARLVDAKHGEFAALTVADCERRHGKAITDTAAYVALTTGPYGKILSGRAAA